MTASNFALAGAPLAAHGAGERERPLARRAWWLYVAAVALLTGAYLLAHFVGPGWLNSGPVYNLIGASTVAALLLGARNCPPERRLPWQLFALGQGLFVVGDVLAYNYRRLFDAALPSPSIADPFHLALYPLLIAGLLLLMRERNRARDRAALIDALIITVALASLAWVYLMAPYAEDSALSLPTKLTSIAYPVMDILILAVVARAAAASGQRREPAFTLLFFGTVALLLTDALHGWRLLHGGYHTGGLLDGGWATFYALLGAAALHPSLRLAPAPAPEPDGRLTRARLALLTCASLTALLLIVAREALGDPFDIYVLIAASGIMFALVIARMAGIVRRNEEVTRREAALRAEALQAKLDHQAFHDTLTGLPNRALFRNRLEHALAGRRRGHLPVAVLFLDVDDFKNINDSLGHAVGDEVLLEVARRLQDCMRPVDTIARLGGDEFAILIHDAESELHSVEIAQRVKAALELPIALADREVTVAASVGIAFSDQGMISAHEAEELLRNADAAMYMAKEDGKGDYRVFQPEMHAKALARLELKADLQRALDAGEFTLRYQPIMDLLKGDVGGMEALIRWEHPVRGIVSPADFVPLLEDTGLIVPVGQHILEQACRWAAHMQRECPRRPPLSMAVNVSAFQLQRPEFIEEVRGALADSEIPPSSLTLELTESVMMRDMEVSLMRLKALRALGVKLAIDDFGTGYSSLNYVRKLPVDILKIDRSFLADRNPEVAELTAAIAQLARIFKLKAVAEGIEDPGQLRRVQAMRCDFAQGFYFAKPLTAEEILELVASQSTLVSWPAEWARV